MAATAPNDVEHAPLSGVRVLDLTRALAGPFCTMLLGDLGAEVTKVEPLPDGDMCRSWGPFHGGEGTYFLSANRNKRSVAVDLTTPAGAAVVRRLAATHDVVVDNFRPGVMASLGLDHPTLVALDPRTISCSITGFGSSGPLAQWPGYDQIAQGFTGVMSVTGPPGMPTRMGLPIADLLAAIFAALGITAAIARRAVTGRGGTVETSLIEALVGVLCLQGQRYLSLGEVPRSAGNDHPLVAAYGEFQASDGPLNIACANEKQWRGICEQLDLAALIADPRFSDNTERMRNREEMKTLLNQRLATRSQDEWVARLNEAGIPCGPIYTIDRALSHMQVSAREMILTTLHPAIGELRLLGTPVKIDGEGDVVRRHPPLLGEHSREVLADAAFSPDEIASLLQSFVVRGVPERVGQP